MNEIVQSLVANLDRLLRYVLPENPFALLVTVLILGVFVWFWVYPLKQLKRELRGEALVLDRLKDNQLIGTVKNLITQQISLDQIDEYLMDQKISKASLTGKMFSFVCVAGFQASRLEANELLALSEQRFERAIDSIKIVLSTFIVLGLFGTMFGLADSFSGMSQIFLREPRYTDLYELLSKLRSALAPSIWGVFFTVIGMFSYRSLLSKHYSPYMEGLKEAIVTLWIPQLYPTSPQKWSETLEKSSLHLEYVLNEVTKASKLGYDRFADSAATMAGNLVQLNELMGSTIKSSHAFKKSMTSIDRSSSILANALEKLESSLAHQDKFMQEYKDSVTGISAEWRDQVGMIENQNAEMHKLLEMEQENSHQLRESITVNFQKSNDLLNVLNEEVPAKLQKIAEEIRNLDSPLEQSAEDIRKVFSSLSTYLESELQPYIEKLIKKVDVAKPLNDHRDALIDHFRPIKESNEAYMKELIQACDGSRKAVEALVSSHAFIEAKTEVMGQLSHLKASREAIDVMQIALLDTLKTLKQGRHDSEAPTNHSEAVGQGWFPNIFRKR